MDCFLLFSGGVIHLSSEQHLNEEVISTGDDARTDDPLEKALRRIRRTKEFPSISKYLIEINQKLSEHAIQSSASELANIILKDYALTNKLLKLVNSAFYGFVAGKVTTVTRAVVLLGYENVRMAAVSLLLFEHFKSKSEARDLKDATISSFWCGLIAKEIAKMQFMIDPEEAFICALLHQLGKLLTIYHMPHEYREIKYRVTQCSEKEMRAVKQVLGISYKSLGLAIARQWNFPQSIFNTMVPLSAEALEDKSKRIDPLCAVANFVNALCRIISTVHQDRRDDAIKILLERYHNYITISARQLKTLMGSCLDKLFNHADALQFSIEESDFLMRLSGMHIKSRKGKIKKALDQAGDGQADSGPAFRLFGDEEINASAATADGDDAVSIIMSGVQEVSNAMMGDHDINDIALMSLEIIYRALQCRRALLFIHEGRSKMMEVRFGYGADIQRFVGKVRFSTDVATDSDLFSQSLKSGKDLIVDDSQAPELYPLIPPWYTATIDARAFIFMPIAYQKICVGAYYADLQFAGPPVNTLEHKYLSMLRNQLILGIKMGR